MKLLKFLLFTVWVGIVFSFSPVWAETRKGTDQLPDSSEDDPKGDTLSIRRLLDRGISVNATNKRGETLLMFAAFNGDLVRMKYLIHAGADLNQRGGILKNSPLDCAVGGDVKEAVDLLLASGVDINERSPWGVTAVHKAGRAGNYTMFRYLKGKGAILSDEDKIGILISCGSYYNNPEGGRIVMREILQDMHVEKKDIMTSPFMPRESQKEVCDNILAMQDRIAQEIAEEKAEQSRQDSLRRLLDAGQADTIRYRYYTESHTDMGNGETIPVIQKVPRIDDVDNKLGTETTGAFLLLLALTFLLLYYLSGLMIKNVYKEKPILLFHLINFVIGGFPLYMIISSLYTNLDDIVVRKFGEEKEAKLYCESVRYRAYVHRRGIQSTNKQLFSFQFVNDQGVRIQVNQGDCKFDSEYMKDGISDITVKVRYDAKSMKLSVDDDKYLTQNITWILCMCFLGILLLLLCLGKLNKILAMLPKKVKKSGEGNVYSMPALLSTYWQLSSKRYSSKKEFLEDVRRSEELYNLEEADCLNPDHVILEVNRVTINLLNSDIEGENDLCIEIAILKGECFTEGELLFQVHNKMIPHLRRVGERVLVYIILFAEPKEGEPAECVLVFEEVENETDH